MVSGWFLLIQLLIILGLMYEVLNHRNRITKLELEKQERINYLTDPKVIDAELERSARRREAYDSKMAYPPRTDSGPAATQYLLPMPKPNKFKRPIRYRGGLPPTPPKIDPK